MNAIQCLFRRLTFPSARQKLSNDIFDSLLTHLLLALKLLSQHDFLLTKLHLGLGVEALAERCCHIRIVGVRVLPELSGEALTFLPVWEQMRCQQRKADNVLKRRIGQIKEVPQHHLVLLGLCTLVDLLKCIDTALKD